jgi:hypothetical protein
VVRTDDGLRTDPERAPLVVIVSRRVRWAAVLATAFLLVTQTASAATLSTLALGGDDDVHVTCPVPPALWWDSAAHTSLRVVCPAPVPTPTPVATPAPSLQSPSPAPTPVTVPRFGSRPASGPISLSGSACQGVTIRDKTFRALGTGVIAISLSGCNGVTIDAVDFDTVAEGVFAYNSRNITIRNTRYSNIIGPHQRNGSHRGNLVQFDTVTGFLISGNKGKGGDTEDIVSLFKTNTGRVTGNQFEGTNWSSGSGTGIIAGDGGGGSGVEIDDNVLVNPGQVGIQLINGNANVHDNVIYAAPRTGTSPNVGISTYGGTVSGARVTNERVYWRKNDGSQNPFWWGAGTPAQTGNNWRDTTLDPASLAVSLG